MDANLIGLLLLLVLLGRGGWDSFDRRRQRQTDRAADQQRWAGLELNCVMRRGSISGSM